MIPKPKKAQLLLCLLFVLLRHVTPLSLHAKIIYTPTSNTIVNNTSADPSTANTISIIHLIIITISTISSLTALITIISLSLSITGNKKLSISKKFILYFQIFEIINNVLIVYTLFSGIRIFSFLFVKFFMVFLFGFFVYKRVCSSSSLKSKGTNGNNTGDKKKSSKTRNLWLYISWSLIILIGFILELTSQLLKSSTSILSLIFRVYFACTYFTVLFSLFYFYYNILRVIYESRDRISNISNISSLDRPSSYAPTSLSDTSSSTNSYVPSPKKSITSTTNSSKKVLLKILFFVFTFILQHFLLVCFLFTNLVEIGLCFVCFGGCFYFIGYLVFWYDN